MIEGAFSEFLDEYRQALHDAALAGAEEQRLEDARKIVFSRLVKAQGDVAVAKAEHLARADAAYEDATDELSVARKTAAGAGAKAEYLRARWETWRTRAATARARSQ